MPKNYKDMFGRKNMLGKAIKHIIEQEKRTWIVAKKLHPPP